MLKVVLKSAVGVAVVGGLMMTARNASAAVDSFLVFNEYSATSTGGKQLCPTEGTDRAHPGAIQLSNYAFDSAQTLNIGSQSTGAGAGKITFNPFSFTRKVDSATACIAGHMARGQAINATLYVRKSAGGNATPFEFLVVNFRMVAFNAQSIAYGDEAPIETVKFEYGAVTIKYTPQLSTGAAGTPVTYGWDRVRNVAISP